MLTPAELLHDLFGSKALLKLAAAKHLSEDEYLSLYRPRRDDVSEVRWTENDVALLDEARSYLGARPTQPGQNGHGSPSPTPTRSAPTATSSSTRCRTSRRCSCGWSSRRSLNGSMTVVGDIAQATGALAPNDWDDVLRYLPDQKPSRVIGLASATASPRRSWRWPTR